MEDSEFYKEHYYQKPDSESKTQPKVFVGTFHEFVNLCHDNHWNRKKTRILNGFDSLDKLRGLTLSEQDVYYGETTEEFSSNLLMTIYQELKIIFAKGNHGTAG